MMKRIMILGASELQVPAIITAQEMGLQVISLDMNPDSVGFKIQGVIYEVISTLDKEAVLEAAKRYKIDAITTICADFAMNTVAYVAETLQLPGISVKAAYTATNKAALRRRLAEHGIPIPKFARTCNKKEFLEAIQKFDNKVVVKAVDNAGSKGIIMIDNLHNLDEVSKAYDYCVPFSHTGEILIEEFMEGPEVCVETLSVNGQCYPIQITDQLHKEPPFFTDSGYNQPSLLDEETQEKIREVAIATNIAVENYNGSSCTEIIITKDGPKIVEIGPRLAGDYMTTHLVPLSCGVDMVKAVINIALGESVDVEKKFNKGSCIRYYMKPTIGKIIAYHGLEEAKKVPGVQEIFIFKKPGDTANELRGSGDRLFAVLAQKDTPEEAIECCEMALNMISVEVE